MREIKFRAQYVEDKTWKYGYLNSIGDFAVICADNGRMYYQCFKETVGQFTGLRDKNGQEIYEGDIITSKYFGRTAVRWSDEQAMYLGFCCNPILFYTQVQIDGLEIIGNIYENPELLEGLIHG